VGVICVGQDITAKKNTMLLQERVVCIEDMLVAASHDLRIPIQSIRDVSNIFIKMQDQHVSESDVEMLNQILCSSCDLLHMYASNLDDIEHTSSASESRVALADHNPVDLATELSSMLASLDGGSMQNPGVEIIADIDKTCPSVCCPKSQLLRAIMNPMTNAMRYTTRGHVTFKLRWSLVDDHHVKCCIDISDTGKGMTELQLKTVTVLCSTSDAETMGIGMHVSKTTIEGLGGTLNIRSALGQGTTVAIEVALRCHSQSLPNVEGDEKLVEIEEDTTVVVPTPMSTPHSSVRVLLVDDTIMNSALGKTMLEKLNCSVTLAYDGEEALDLLKRQGGNGEYDLVLMDIDMPGMSGTDCVLQYRAWEAQQRPNSRTRVYAHTSKATVVDKLLYDSCGCDGCLVKPCNPRKLRHLVMLQ